MMKLKKSARVGLGWILGTMLLLPGCGGGGSSPTESGTFIPDIPNVSWIESGKPSHRFFFLVAKPNVEHSTFDGNEFIGAGGATPLTGAYTGREIHFTIQRSAGNVLYQGQFRDANTMVLSSATAGGLTLVRGTS
jgi:hypothetical protein